MKSRYFPLALCIIMIMACGNPDTQVAIDIASPVSVEEITWKPIEEFITATGTVNATQDVQLQSESAGYYHLAVNPQTSRPFILGDFVEKDTVIIFLENPEQENSIRIKSHELNLDISQSEFEKQKSLYEKGGVTLRELKNAEKSLIDAKYAYENALIQLSKLKVTAPFDGIIVDLLYYTEGVKVAANSEMVHLMNYRKLTMDAKLPGRFLGSIRDSQRARVSNYTVPGKVFEGIVSQVSPALEPESRTFKISLAIDNPDLILRPGMFIKVEVIIAGHDSTIVIPKDIIMTRRNRKIVFVVDRGTAFERAISTGLENPDQIEITEGLSVNERLVVDGFETLQNRSKVKVVQ